MQHMASRPFAKALVLIEQPGQCDSSLHVSPVTLEMMDDGVATISTVLMRLPTGSQLALASSLVSMRVYYSGGGSSSGGGGRGKGALIQHRGSSTA